MARKTIASLEADVATLKAQIEFLSAKHPALAPEVQTVIAQVTTSQVGCYEVQARKDGSPFYSERFAEYPASLYKMKALQKAGWIVTRYPRNADDKRYVA